ncbi:MAG: hypothetical protein A7316_00885 [Candidatus Altiarchaeales archaeon WOR_SM1_86-2]|nr:MAG: hypothetical protein A7316_00885 [Candidatus Altiarchaeales archaeon WOR_SM1_86-2]
MQSRYAKIKNKWVREMKTKNWMILGLGMIIVVSGLALAANADKKTDELDTLDSIQEAQASGKGYAPGEIIVKFKPGVKDEVISGINSKHGASMLYTSRSAGFKRLRIPKGKTVSEMVKIYNKNPNVEYAEPNYIAYALMTPNDPYYGYQWHLDNDVYGGINMECAWDISTGSNVIVAVIDTGVAYENYGRQYKQAPDLANTCFVAGYDFVNDDSHPNDDNSHGTHVAGTVAQSTNNNNGVAGVAFEACIMPVKVLNKQGSGSYSWIADGIYYAADNGAQVISMSLGGSSSSSTLEEALAYAYDKGVTIVAAAGNDGMGGPPLYPAAYDAYVIAVGATRYDETRAPYSTTGDYVDIAAPGGDTSVDQNGDSYADGVLQNTFNPSTKNTRDFGYWFLQGTSMATPHVSGAAALLIADGVATTPDEVRDALQSTAEDKGDPGWDPEYGWGIVDAYAALTYTLDTIPPSAVSDLAAGNPTLTSVTLTWTATGDDGNVGTAGSYDIRYSTLQITDANWDTATKATGEPKPQPSGSAETFKVTGLSYSTTYYFALKVLDDAGNPSGLSNVFSETTATPITIFEDDMESGVNGWTTEGANNLWELGTPTFGPGSAYSESNAWATKLEGNYGVNNALENLTSEPIDLTYVNSAILVFQNRYDTETGYDGGVILISTDDGNTWQYVEYEGYDQGLSGTSWYAFTGSSGGWRQEEVDLTPYVGNMVRLRFEFRSDSSINDYPGWYIDDVSILAESAEPECTTNADCDDYVSCTDDSCVSGVCVYTPNDAKCPADGWVDNGVTQWVSTGPCTEKEQKEQEQRDYYCDATLDCPYNVANTQWVDTGNTGDKADGTSCEDGLFCTVGETCQSGACTGGQDRDCSDGAACTDDSCDETNGVCVNTPITTCTYDDGCCLEGCDHTNDNDCLAVSTMHTGNITFTSDVRSWRTTPYCKVTVTVPIIDASNAGVKEAEVYGSWSGAYNEDVSGTTSGEGLVSFRTGWVRGCGTFTFTVNDVTKTDWVYDPSANIETSDSITLP